MKVCSYERHLYIITFSQCLSCQGAMNCVSKCMIVRACVQCSELCSCHLFLLPWPGIHIGRRVTTIGLEVVKTGMVAHGLKRSSQCIKRYHGMTAHHPQSAVAIRVGGTKTQLAVATGSQAIQGCKHQPAVAIRVGGTKTQAAIATGSQAIHGSKTQPAVATGSHTIDGSDPSQL